MIIGSRFQNRITNVSGGYPWEIITYCGDINGGFIEYLAGISIVESLGGINDYWLAISKLNH